MMHASRLSSVRKQSTEPPVQGLLQRKCGGSSTTLPGKGIETARPLGIPPLVHEVTASRGQSLDADTRSFMEPRFGKDFSGVRVHTDARAAESAKEVNALAYTAGEHVVFGTGQYRPDSQAGMELLAHELAHVAQQKKADGSTFTELGDPKDSMEGEADRTASRVMKGASADANAQDAAGALRRFPGPFPGVFWDPKIVMQSAPNPPYTQALTQVQGADAEIYKYLSATSLNGGSKVIRTAKAVDNSTTPPTSIQFVFNLEVKHDSKLPQGTDAAFDGGLPALTGSGANRTFTASMTMKVNPGAASVSLAQALYHEGIHMILFMEDLLPGSPPSPHATALANYQRIAKGHKDTKPLATEIEAFVKAGQTDPTKPTKAAAEIPAHLLEEKYVFDQEKAKFKAAFTNRQLAFTYLLDGFSTFGVTAKLTDPAVVSMGDKAAAIFDDIDKQVAPASPTPIPNLPPKKNP